MELEVFMMVKEQGAKKCMLMLAAFVLLIGQRAAAQEQAAEAMGLGQVLDAAAKNNPSLAASRQRWEEKTMSIAITAGWPMPELGVMFDDIPTSSLNPGDGMMREYSLSQEIMNPAKLIAMRGMAHSEAGMAGADYHARQMQVYVDTKQAYYDFLYAQKAVEIMRENQELMRQFSRVSETNYSSGVSPLQDTLRSQTEVSRMAADILNMEAMARAAGNRVNYLLGRPANTPLALREEFSPRLPEFDAAELERQSKNSPAIQGMNWELEMAKNKVSMAHSEFWPDFKVSFSLLRSKVMDPMLMTMGMGMSTTYSLEMKETSRNSWKVGFMVMLPLWFGQYQAKADSAAAGVEAARAALRDMENMAGMDVSMALGEAQSAWRLTGLYGATVVPQAEQTYEALIVGYTNGKADFMSVMDSLTTLRNARLDYYRARVDYEKAIGALERITGLPLFPEAKR